MIMKQKHNKTKTKTSQRFKVYLKPIRVLHDVKMNHFNYKRDTSTTGRSKGWAYCFASEEPQKVNSDGAELSLALLEGLISAEFLC